MASNYPYDEYNNYPVMSRRVASECECPRCGFRVRYVQYQDSEAMDAIRYEIRQLRRDHYRIMEGRFITVAKTPMKLTALAKRILDSDTRVLVEAGWLTSDLSLTNEGKDAFLTHYLQANKKELAAEARKVIADKKKEE